VSSAPPGRAGVPGPTVFITYRREETAAHAGRLYDAMVARFGEGNVFMDVDMAPGVDFVERITEAVAACQVLIVVMGPRWATVEDEQGRPRLADPEDFVRLEVETALRRPGVTPIPVLVAGARMPRREDLPPDVRALTRRNALELSDQRWRYDVGRLIRALDELLGPSVAAGPEFPEHSIATDKATRAEPPAADQTTPPPPPVTSVTPAEAKLEAPSAADRRRLRWALIGVMTIAAVIVAAVIIGDNGSGDNGANGDAAESREAASYQKLVTLLPASIRDSCSDDPDQQWMLEGGAQAQALCGPEEDYYLTYGLWPSPSEAQAWVGGAADDPEDVVACETSTTEAMDSILPRATTGCQDKVEAGEISIWWNEDRSPVTGWFTWNTHDQKAALNQWEALVTAQ